jgi:hypothetical protein
MTRAEDAHAPDDPCPSPDPGVRVARPRRASHGCRRPGGAAARAGDARLGRRSDRPVRGAAARARADRHRERAGRPDVAGAPPRLLEPARRGGAGREHVDVDEARGAAGRHPPGARRVRAGAAQPPPARARLPDRRLPAPPGDDGAAGVRDGRRRRGQDVAGRGAHHPRRRPRRPAPALDLGVGGREHARPGAAARARDALAGGARALRRQAPRVHDLRPGRRRPVDPPRVPDAPLRRLAVDAGRRAVLPGDVDRHQRRPLLPQRAGRGLQARTTRAPAASTRGTRPPSSP